MPNDQQLESENPPADLDDGDTSPRPLDLPADSRTGAVPKSTAPSLGQPDSWLNVERAGLVVQILMLAFLCWQILLFQDQIRIEREATYFSRHAELLRALYPDESAGSEAEKAHPRVRQDALRSYLLLEREHNPSGSPDLSEIILDGLDLRGINLSGAVLRSASFRGTLLADAHLDEANLESADLSHATLRRGSLQRARLDGAKFFAADLVLTNLDFAEAEYASFARATLRDASLKNAKLASSDFSNAVFEGADLKGGNFVGSSFENANLIGADLRGADLSDLFVYTVKIARVDRDFGRSREHLPTAPAPCPATFLGALIDRAKFEGARYSPNTIWPTGFDPNQQGARLDTTKPHLRAITTSPPSPTSLDGQTSVFEGPPSPCPPPPKIDDDGTVSAE